MVRPLIEEVTEVLNTFPSKDDISDTFSPATIIEVKPKFDFNRNMIAFSTYAMVYTKTTNTMKPRAVPAIALKRSNNVGGHYL